MTDARTAVSREPAIDRPAAVAEAVRAAHEAGDFERAVELITAALALENVPAVAAGLTALRPPDRVDIFETFDLEAQRFLLRELADPDAADLLEELEDPFAGMIAAGLEPEVLAPILDEMETDEAADVLLDLPEQQQAPVLRAMDDAVEAEVRQLLAYPDDSAGGRMTRDYVALRAADRVEAAIDQLRTLGPDDDRAFYLYVRRRRGASRGHRQPAPAHRRRLRGAHRRSHEPGRTQGPCRRRPGDRGPDDAALRPARAARGRRRGAPWSA